MSGRPEQKIGVQKALYAILLCFDFPPGLRQLFETTPISLLMVDTTSGATSISFFAPEGAETAETETAAQ